jgi:subtilisin family serine protease
VQGLINDGVSVAVAAGNSNVDACGTSPARVGAALTVGATSRTDARASFSNYGRCLDLFAPGSSITSAWSTSSSSVATISGTSMAAPHVAGAAAVLLSRQPTLTPAAVADNLTTSATTNVVTGAGYRSPNRLLRAPA